MNNARRKVVRSAIAELRRPSPDFDTVRDDLQNILDEETECMSNMPESLEGSERYCIMEESCDLLDTAIGEIDPEDTNSAQTVIGILEQINGV